MHPVLIVGNLRSRKRKMLWPRARAQLVNNSFETRTGRGVFWPTHIESSRLSSRTYHQTSGCGAVNLFFVLRTASFDCASGGLLSTPSALRLFGFSSLLQKQFHFPPTSWCNNLHPPWGSVHDQSLCGPIQLAIFNTFLATFSWGCPRGNSLLYICHASNFWPRGD